MALSTMIADASIIFANIVVYTLYLLPHVIAYSIFTANVSLPIFRPLYRFVPQLANALGCPYWGAQWGVSVHAGETAAGRPTGDCRSGPAHRGSGASNPAKARLNTMDTTGNDRRKRRKRDDDEKKPPPPIKKTDSGQPSSQFACPFYLHNRHEWHTCLRNYTLNRIVDVRLHLLRVHLLAPQCPNCGREFKGDSAEDRCNTHIQLQNCQRLPFPPPARHGVTTDQLEAMRTIATRRAGRRVADSAAAKWFEMWDIIFPGTARPPSPYITEHPDVQRTRDMNELIFAGEGWRDVIVTTRESSPSLRNASRSTVVAIADGLVASYRRFYRDQGRPAPEIASNTGADTPVSNSMAMDTSFQHSPSWEFLPSSSQPTQATQYPLPTGRPALASTRPDPWPFQQTHGYPSSDRRSQGNPMAHGRQSLSPFPSDPNFFTDAQTQESTIDFQGNVDELLGTSVHPDSPSQFFSTNFGSNTPEFWGYPDADAAGQGLG